MRRFLRENLHNAVDSGAEQQYNMKSNLKMNFKKIFERLQKAWIFLERIIRKQKHCTKQMQSW